MPKAESPPTDPKEFAIWQEAERLYGDNIPNEHLQMPSYARDDDSDYPFLFSDETYEGLMAQAEEYYKRQKWREQRELHKQRKREERAENQALIGRSAPNSLPTEKRSE